MLPQLGPPSSATLWLLSDPHENVQGELVLCSFLLKPLSAFFIIIVEVIKIIYSVAHVFIPS